MTKETNDIESYSLFKQELEGLQQRLTKLEQVSVSEPVRVAQQKALFNVVTKIRESLDVETVFRATATEVRQLLNADRVAVFRFDILSGYSQGEFVSEDVLPEFTSTLAAKIQDHCFGQHHAIYYQRGRVWAADDIYAVNLPDCHIAILSQFQVRANLVVPLMKGHELWGLLCTHQCSEPRRWQGKEIEFVTQIAVHLGVALQQAELLTKAEQRSTVLQSTLEAQLRKRAEELALEAERERAIAKIIERIRQTLDIDAIFRATTQEVRQILGCDRVAVYQFLPDWSGEFVSESVGSDWAPLVTPENQSIWEDTYLQETQGGRYRHQEHLAVDDINQHDHTQCHREILEQLQIRAYCVVPVFVGKSLWGLLAAYQHSGSRHWDAQEVSLLTQIGSQLGVALQQAESLKQLRSQSQQLVRAVEREKAVAAIINKIRRSLDIDTIFQTTVQEARHLLNADRVGIYRFNPDWSGEFTVESVADGWSSLIQVQVRHPELRENVSECSAKLLASPQTDTYLEETAGGHYVRGEQFRICSDIYNAGFSDCYINLLEQYQAKAYAIAAIYQGQQIWGLLAAYQNSGARDWEEADVNFLVQISGQLGVAIQQAELLGTAERRSTVLQSRLEAQLRQRAEELAKEAERERAIAQVIDKIRQTLDIDTIFQTTATEVRQLLNADRVAMFRFEPDSSYCDGKFVSEDVLPDFSSALSAKVHDHCFGENHAIYYQQGRIFAVEDVYTAGLPDCHLAILVRFQVRANLVAPLLKGDELWGMLCIHQCAGPREWQNKEIEFVTKIAGQLGVALQQSDLLTQAQQQSAELQRAKESADAANKAKSEFLASISHELRTPLNAILGFTQLLQNSALNSDQQEYVDIINRSGEHLLTLINDVLEMSKIEAGRITLNQSDFDLYRLLDSLEEMLQLKAQSKGLCLICDRSPDVPRYIHADESKLRQVLINLLGNAIKFTDEGEVMLRVRVTDFDSDVTYPSSPLSSSPLLPSPLPSPTLHFEVSDTGPGIAPAELEKLFEAFVQAETGRKSKEGTGLGLPISRQFVHLMGGEITVRSTLEQGSVFGFDITVQTAEAVSAPQSQTKRQISGLVPNHPPCRILVVEDKLENRQLLVKMMNGIGFQVREAINGQEAVTLWEEWHPHLIWMDIQMPDMNGYEATRQIRIRESHVMESLPGTESLQELTHDPKHRTRIIALTAHAFEEDREMVLSVGCDDFVSKPFRAEVLFEKIAQHLGVEYVYQAKNEDRRERLSENPQLFVTHLQALLDVMPRQWIVDLHQAATNLNDEHILQLIEQIPPSEQPLAIALRELVANFRLDTVIELTQGVTR